MNQNKSEKYLLIFPFVFLLVLHVPFYFIFPPAYGSWQTWANLGDGTYQSYLDAGVLFPPLYIKYYEFINLINKDVWFSVTLGVARTIFIFLLVYLLIIKEGFSKFVASLTSIFYVITFINQDTYLPDDYHSMVKLLYLLNLYFFYLVFKKDNNSKIKNCIYSSIFLVLVFLVKQNIGLMLFIGEIITFIILSIKRKDINFLIPVFLISVISIIVVFSYIFSI